MPSPCTKRLTEVIAIPSGLTVGLAGSQRPAQDKDVAKTLGPSDGFGRSRARPFGDTDLSIRNAPSSGTRPAMKVGRGALDARLAQGRVGILSRQFETPPARHQLLLAQASARTVRFSALAENGPHGDMPSSLRSAPAVASPPRQLLARASVLVRLAGSGSTPVGLGRRLFRGKGVRAV